MENIFNSQTENSKINYSEIFLKDSNDLLKKENNFYTFYDDLNNSVEKTIDKNSNYIIFESQPGKIFLKEI